MNISPSLTPDRRTELETAALELLNLHKVDRPPVPIEDILLHPSEGLWDPDLADLSVPSFNVQERYSARPSLARLVARYAGQSVWAHRRELTGRSGFTPDEARYFASALLMPERWIVTLQASQRNPATVRLRFHVPTLDAAKRLAELDLRPGANP